MIPKSGKHDLTCKFVCLVAHRARRENRYWSSYCVTAHSCQYCDQLAAAELAARGGRA